MNDNEKILELNEKIEMLESQLKAEYLSEYQFKQIMYRLDNLTIARDLLQNKINRQENKQDLDKIDIFILHISYILKILFLLYLFHLVVS